MPKYAFECLGCGQTEEKMVPYFMETGNILYNEKPCACGSADWKKVFTANVPKIKGLTTPGRTDI